MFRVNNFVVELGLHSQREFKQALDSFGELKLNGCKQHSSGKLKVMVLKARSSGGDKPKGCKQHSSGKLKFSSSQTNAHSALASQAALILRVGVGTNFINSKSPYFFCASLASMLSVA